MKAETHFEFPLYFYTDNYIKIKKGYFTKKLSDFSKILTFHLKYMLFCAIMEYKYIHNLEGRYANSEFISKTN